MHSMDNMTGRPENACQPGALRRGSRSQPGDFEQNTFAASNAVLPLPVFASDHVRTVAARACVGCRRLKMKCVGASNPPCSRCLKAGRKCELWQPMRPSLAQPVAPDPSSPQRSLREHLFRNSPWTPLTPESTSAATDPSTILSIYSTSPYYTVVQGESAETPETGENEVNATERQARRRRTDNVATLDDHFFVAEKYGQQQPAQEDREGVSDRDMEQLIHTFRQRLLSYIPVLYKEEVEDAAEMVRNRKPLAYAICYVTARYLPGGGRIREKLYPHIAEIANVQLYNHAANEAENLMKFQALIVLCAYSQASPMLPKQRSKPTSPALKYWMVKALIESYAIQLHLHRSVEGVRAERNSQVIGAPISSSYKMYTYWLWLYTISHHCSLTTRTPPSIRGDATIRAAPKLLGDMGMTPQIARLVGEVELCLLWEKASNQETGLGEWWCLPESGECITEESTVALVREIDDALDSWSQKWENAATAGAYQGGRLDFHLRFTRFCISTYSIRSLKTTRGGLTDRQKDSITRCMAAATEILRWMLSLGPASKDRLRYMSDFGFVMLSFCCFFILHVCHAFMSTIPRLSDNLEIVADAAQLMIEMAYDSSHAPRVYAQSILSRLEKVYDRMEESLAGDRDTAFPEPFGNHELMSRIPRLDGFELSEFNSNDFELSMSDSLWDQSMLSPDMVWN